MLKEKLQTQVDKSKAKVSLEAKSVMAAAIAFEIDSLPKREIPEAGDSLPEFELADSKGNNHRSIDLVESGSLILSFFRGGW